MTLSELGDNAWKVEMLLAVTAAILLIFVPLLLRSQSIILAGIAAGALAMSAAPLVAMIGFYLLGWPTAVGLLILGRFIVRTIVDWVVTRRFAQAKRPRRSIGQQISGYAAIALAAYVIVIDDRELLRFLPFLIFLSLFVNLIVPAAGAIRSGAFIFAGHIAMIVVAVVLVVCSEMLWRHASFEHWIWFYAWLPLMAFLSIGMLLLPIALWTEAGEPGLRDP
jgi:hypothetical protein